MHVFKFGGASVRDAVAIRNLTAIVRPYLPAEGAAGGGLLLVVSAIGKTTNVLEDAFRHAYAGSVDAARDVLGTVRHAHLRIAADLFPAPTHAAHAALGQVFERVAERLATTDPAADFDEQYDQVVSAGELASSTLLAHWLREAGLPAQWLDARPLLRTDRTWREGRIDWPATETAVQAATAPALAAGQVLVTQGFLGATPDGRTTTLGREGSDYSAAIFAYCLGATGMTIWKDVPGLLNADPKVFTDTVLYPEISYQETIEMAYYGASVIHPKTIQPLAARRIPLRVRSFVDPTAPGTLIHDCQHPRLAPAFIQKTNQVLISFETRDFTFVSEAHLDGIFAALAQVRLHANLMQNSALSFSVVADYDETRLRRLRELLSGLFNIRHNTAGLTLYTVRNSDAASRERVTAGREVVLEQRTRQTFQVLVREEK
ncbi:MAG: aspartate kinase [Hymenobacteraceae bacterium]|nr:aspartate kinase [Hymenobacteraceae bacterium]